MRGLQPLRAAGVAIAELLDWLAARAASGTVVRTVGEVIGGTVKPGVPTPPLRPGNLLGNASLENDVDRNGVADCWQRAGYGTNTFSWARVAGRTGGTAEQLTVSAISSGDRKLISALDNGSCAPKAVPGREYRVSGWYAVDRAGALRPLHARRDRRLAASGTRADTCPRRPAGRRPRG